MPGAGILIGGAITALGSPRTALAVAGVGSLAVTAAIWFVLRNLASGPVPAAESATNGSDPAPVTDPEIALDGADLLDTRREEARTAAVRHQ